MWAVMEVPGKDQVDLISNAITFLELKRLEKLRIMENATAADSSVEEKPTEPKSIDRQIRVLFSVPENVAAKVELPDLFYNLSMRGKGKQIRGGRRLRLLIPKSYREKQMKAGRKRHTRTMIRVQFPDGVVLQDVFAPWEPTTALYEFVAMDLKEPCLEFELIKFKPIETDSVVFTGLRNELLEIIERLQ